MVDFGFNVGKELASFQAPSADYTPLDVGFLDKLKFGAKQAFKPENIGSTGSALNLLGKIFGASERISGPVGEFGKSITASEAAKSQKTEQQQMFQMLISAMSGGGFTPEGTGGGTELKLIGGEDGAVTGILKGDIATPTKDSSVTQENLLTGGTLGDLLP